MYKVLTKPVADMKKGSIIIDDRDEVEGQVFYPDGRKSDVNISFNLIDKLYDKESLIPIENTYWRLYGQFLEKNRKLPRTVKIIRVTKEDLTYIRYKHDCCKPGGSSGWSLQGLLEQYRWVGQARCQRAGNAL